MIIPSRLRAARLYRGMTQAQLAAAVGIDKCNISQYENGKQQPYGSTLLKISLALQVKPVMLAGEQPFPWEKEKKPERKDQADPDAPGPAKITKEYMVIRHTVFGGKKKRCASREEAERYCADLLKSPFEAIYMVTK